MKNIFFPILFLLFTSVAYAGESNPTSTKDTITKPVQLKFFATNWGWTGTWDAFCEKAKGAGYDGIEVWLPSEEENQKEMLAAVKKYGLQLAFLCGGWDDNASKQYDGFEKYLKRELSFKPVYINCHTGRDFFSFEQNQRFIELTIKLSRDSGIPIYHETHRSRFSYSAAQTRQFMEKIPGLRLTLDISHWCVVSESLLDDQQETVQMAISRTDHIHARIGHPEAPQVNDPRAPEWASALEHHLTWWDGVLVTKTQEGAKEITVTPEFGPPTYMPTLPYTQQPVANQWEINVWMMNLLRERYNSN